MFNAPHCGKDLLDAAAEYFEASFCGKVTIERRNGTYRFSTGGWSGCEEVIESLMSNVFSSRLWESSHRGGIHIFNVSNDIVSEKK